MGSLWGQTQGRSNGWMRCWFVLIRFFNSFLSGYWPTVVSLALAQYPHLRTELRINQSW
jgi:hypothetical protein